MIHFVGKSRSASGPGYLYTFGPRMHMADGRVVSNFILQALQDEPITVSKIGMPHLFNLQKMSKFCTSTVHTYLR